MECKRKTSSVVPYIKEKKDILVYLQKRSKDAERFPGCFGFFGGGIEENESPEEALKRELKEEINFIPKNFTYFKRYEFCKSIENIFIMEVDSSFEQNIKILEGEYGKWFKKDEVFNEPKLVDHEKPVLQEIYNFFDGKS